MKTVERKLHTIDASGKAIGRIASEAVIILRGKNKPEYQPNVDAGDSVTVTNISQAKFTGAKFTDKMYYHFSGYPGGLKATALKDLFAKNPGEVLKKAVQGMLPRNKMRAPMLKRLTIK
jgi:large subunit ribosomal protein L13